MHWLEKLLQRWFKSQPTVQYLSGKRKVTKI
jgi:hypothetical protein